MKFLFLFVVVLVIITINMADNMIARLGFDANYFSALLTALAIAGLLKQNGPLVIVLALFVALGANLPPESVLNFGIDRDYLFGALLGLILTPIVVDHLG